MHKRTDWKVLLTLLPGILVLSVGCAGTAAAEPAPAEQAQRILDAAAVDGGPVVHLGCRDGKLTAALAADEGYLVQGLTPNAADVKKARRYIRSTGKYGRVTIEQLAGERLPYVDNLVTLLVAQRPMMDIPRSELMRVIAPGGVLYLREGDGYSRHVKPRPENIDRWTHYLHDATNNAVADDTKIGPPRSIQWLGSPKWARHHDRMASLTALVSTGSRIFYVFDEGPTEAIMLPAEPTLIARDAFNGTVLWKRRLPSWHPYLWPMKSGFAQLPRRLVASGDRVYVPLGYEKPLSCLDAATGETIRTYQNTAAAEEVILSDGVLFVLVNKKDSQYDDFKPAEKRHMWAAMRRAASNWPWNENPGSIMAIDADTGSMLWKSEYRVAPLTMAANDDCVFFHDGKKIICLSRDDGSQLWASEAIDVRFPLEDFTGGRKAKQNWKPSSVQRAFIPASYGPTLVIYEDVVLFRGGTGTITGLSAKTGDTLWEHESLPGGHFSPQDILVADGLVYSGDISHGGHRGTGLVRGLDPQSGDVKKELPSDTEAYFMHHRCYRARATNEYMLPSRTGIEFVDFDNGHWDINHWVRGGCMYGFMPANGLLYAPPHSCACYMSSKQNGFNALSARAPAPKIAEGGAEEGRLARGPGYGKTKATSPDTARGPHDWPTYRHDGARSGSMSAPLPKNLKLSWDKEIGGNLSAPVIADGKVFIARVDQHTVYAVDADTGDTVWQYTAGGRVDSPPTFYRGKVIFGCADGWVYCLRASDGNLVWKFRAAPAERNIVAFEQIESPWPVHGSVLIEHDTVYCVAGRCMFLDGGMRLLRLDPDTGKKISETVLDNRDPDTGKSLQTHIKRQSMPVARSDVLSGDGEHVFMRMQRFNLKGVREDIALPSANRFKQAAWQGGEGRHLFSPIGFLDGSWWHRAYWVYGTSFAEGAGGYPIAGKFAPAGRILVHDKDNVYGYGRKQMYFRWTTPLEYRLFAAKKKLDTRKVRYHRRNPKLKMKASKPVYDWSRNIDVQVRGMVKAADSLYIAGPPDVVNEEKAFSYFKKRQMQKKLAEQSAALHGEKGAALWIVSAKTGDSMAGYELQSPPAWDAMAAANGRLYLATMDGRLLCLGETGEALPEKEPRKQQVKRGLIAHWKFDERQGDKAEDSSGNLFPATIKGAEWVDGKMGGALKFSGKDSFVECEIYDALYGDTSFSLEAWAKPADVPVREFPPGPYAIIGRPGCHCHTAYYPNEHIGFQIFDDSRNQIRLYTPKEQSPKQWYHVVGVFDRENDSVRLYVNGREVASQPFVGTLFGYPPKLYVGCGNPTNKKHPHWFKGIIDEVRIYQGALSAEKIAQHYQAEK